MFSLYCFVLIAHKRYHFSRGHSSYMVCLTVKKVVMFKLVSGSDQKPMRAICAVCKSLSLRLFFWWTDDNIHAVLTIEIYASIGLNKKERRSSLSSTWSTSQHDGGAECSGKVKLSDCRDFARSLTSCFINCVLCPSSFSCLLYTSPSPRD